MDCPICDVSISLQSNLFHPCHGHLDSNARQSLLQSALLSPVSGPFKRRAFVSSVEIKNTHLTAFRTSASTLPRSRHNMSEIPPLPNPHRYITANDEHGSSLFSEAEVPELNVHNDLGGAKQRLAYTSDRPKISLSNDTDLKSYQASLKDLPALVRSDGGANVWVIDTPPGSKSPMHRTVSLDIVIQVHGQIKLTMSNGDSRLINPGDITIQRSTLHEWSNPSITEWSRFIGIMTETEPFIAREAGLLATEFRH